MNRLALARFVHFGCGRGGIRCGSEHSTNCPSSSGRDSTGRRLMRVFLTPSAADPGWEEDRSRAASVAVFPSKPRFFTLQHFRVKLTVFSTHGKKAEEAKAHRPRTRRHTHRVLNGQHPSNGSGGQQGEPTNKGNAATIERVRHSGRPGERRREGVPPFVGPLEAEDIHR